jgi:HTH-type transcriptional regulator/antitoxin HigA
MAKIDIPELTARFQALVEIVPLHAIRSDSEYEIAVTLLNQLLDAGAAEEYSALADLACIVGDRIGDYEDASERNNTCA